MKFSVYIIVFYLGFNFLFSQNPDKQKFEYAKTFEQSGDFQNSGRIFKELFEKHPDNESYFKGLTRAYKYQNKYTELLELTRQHLEYVRDFDNYNLYAELLWRTGSTDSANEYWGKAINLAPEKQETYLTISNTQVELQQYEKALNTLEKGREEIGNNRIFADELCRMYIAIGDYEKGTKEALNILYDTKNIALAQGRISALLTSKEAKNHVNNTLENAIRKQPNNYFLLKVCAWFLRTEGELEKAFNIYKQIENMTNTKGREVYNFANDSHNDGQYDIALKAYEFIISMGKESRYLSSALYGYPRTLEQKLLTDTSLSKGSAERIISYYRQIIEEFPKNNSAADARYRIALIAHNYLNDDDLAINEINILKEKFHRHQVTAKAMNLLGEIYQLRDSLNEAKRIYNDIIRRFEKGAKEEALKAKYKLAEIEFFDGNLDSAQKIFAELSNISNSDIANDALEKVILLIQNKEQTKGLREYAQAMKFEKKNDLSEAIKHYLRIYEYTMGTNLAELCLLRASELYFNRSEFDSSLIYLDLLLNNYKKTIYMEKALLISSRNYIRLNRFDDAIASLNKLIILFPRSIYIQEARDKIRELKESKNL
jgi:tetratricopeptide (TPR) repeat protein